MNTTVKERRVEVGGVSTRYLTAGEGPPVVLLHGIGTSALEWRRAMPTLARGRLVYAPDVLGPGAGPDGGHSPAALAGFVAEFLDAVGGGPLWWATRWAASWPCAWRSPTRTG